MTRPSFRLERQYEGIVAGVDEAGRGPWAGPVMAAAVIFTTRRAPKGLNDSKKLSSEAREDIYGQLLHTAIYSFGEASVEEIDTLNILGATKLAMQRAVAGLPLKPTLVLVDGNQPPAFHCPALPVVGGDAISHSIAAASILAKVNRDRHMQHMCLHYPSYGFSKHKGYGTQEHKKALSKYGPCALHRRSFAPIRALLSEMA